MEYKAKAYIWLTKLLSISQTDSKNQKSIIVIVFSIEIDISSFTI